MDETKDRDVGFTAKQLKAIEMRVEGHIKTECYRAAYNTENMNMYTIQKKAFELFENPKIAEEVKRRKSEGFREYHVELDEVLALMADSLKVGSELE